MAAVGMIQKVIHEFKSILASIEKEIKNVISKIGIFCADEENRLKVLLTTAFKDIKKDISSIIQRIEDRIHALEKKRMSTSTGPSAKSFPQRIKNAFSAAAKDGEKIVDDFKAEFKEFVEECRKVIGKMSADVEKVGVKTADVTRNAAIDVFHALETVGKEAISKVREVGSAIAKNLEVDASFAFHHGVQVAEAATMTLVDPGFVVCVLLSGAAMFAASKYEPS